MILRRLTASHFRNIGACDISFQPGVNVLCGQNAQGKTNALECIYLFARGRSFRGASESEMTQFGEKGFFASVAFSDRNRDQTLSWRYYEGRRRRQRNGADIERVGEMLGHFRAVLFTPDHLQLVKGGPEMRREFLNIAISQENGEYLRRYAIYKKILENRNFLLKSASKGQYFDREELSAWTAQMAHHAAYLSAVRMAYVRRIDGYARQILLDLSGGAETLVCAYESDTPGEGEEEREESYLRAFASLEKREMAAGCSLAGVHRDDMSLVINGTDARSFASQGQQRSVVLSLKMAEGEESRAACGEYPVFLFDDVLSELDEKRRAYVFSGAGERQFVVTSCEKELFSSVNAIHVEGGRYVSSCGER